ncbi:MULTISPECIES: hypothetical protein [unclassified Streptomyces]|uniref:hypothetical protein n=1 Tax=unclassified Streptomyces TaxID=2593676 RepID=UPI001488B80F|nr:MULTISPECIES: hypothetical protein [unclassified Streptomyces]
MSAPIPTPEAVHLFAARLTRPHVIEAALAMDDAERVLSRPMSPLSVEDWGDREIVLADWHRAKKVLASTALRPGEPTEVRS